MLKTDVSRGKEQISQLSSKPWHNETNAYVKANAEDDYVTDLPVSIIKVICVIPGAQCLTIFLLRAISRQNFSVLCLSQVQIRQHQQRPNLGTLVQFIENNQPISITLRKNDFSEL